MQLMLIRHTWGVSHPLKYEISRFVKEGYSGIETDIRDPFDATELSELASQNEMKLIIQIFTEGQSVDEHIASFETQLKRAATVNPLMVNCHAGVDAFSLVESAQFFKAALDIEKTVGVDVAFETHRGRILFNPWITRDMLLRFDSLKLCVDFSHWVCVCERLIDDQLDIIKLCSDRTLHLHARVGYEQGPQVPDPAAPEYQEHLHSHEKWWDMVWASQQARGMKISTLTPEFGPPNYLQTLPYTNQPVADLRQICNWQANRQAKRFTAIYS